MGSLLILGLCHTGIDLSKFHIEGGPLNGHRISMEVKMVDHGPANEAVSPIQPLLDQVQHDLKRPKEGQKESKDGGQ